MYSSRNPRIRIFSLIAICLLVYDRAPAQPTVHTGTYSSQTIVLFDQNVELLPNLLAIETETFDDSETRFPPGTDVPALSLYEDRLTVEFSASTPGGVPYIFQSSNYFSYPEAVDYQALVMGTDAATLTFGMGDVVVGGIGFWVFDDGNARDSIYRIRVIDRLGRVEEAFLENDGPRIDGYQMEGFFGAISTVGIASVSITSVDPATELPWMDIFEIDTLTIALMPAPIAADNPDEIPAPPIDPNVEEDRESDDDSMDRNNRCRRRGPSDRRWHLNRFRRLREAIRTNRERQREDRNIEKFERRREKNERRKNRCDRRNGSRKRR